MLKIGTRLQNQASLNTMSRKIVSVLHRMCMFDLNPALEIFPNPACGCRPDPSALYQAVQRLSDRFYTDYLMQRHAILSRKRMLAP